MVFQSLYIFNIIIISIFQIYLVARYYQQKKLSKLFGNLLIYVFVMLFLIYEHIKLNIPSFILTCSLITIIGNSFVGSYLNIYYKSKHFDRYLHLFGSFSFSLLAFSVINNIIPFVNESMVYTFILVFTLGVTIGVFFEIIEFAHDCFSKKMKCQHGLVDTDTDMIFNMIGSFIAGIISINLFS